VDGVTDENATEENEPTGLSGSADDTPASTGLPAEPLTGDTTTEASTVTPSDQVTVAPLEDAGSLTWRRRIVLFLVILASFGMLTSTVAVWTHRTLLDTENWVETVGPVAKDPAVQEALAQFLTTQAMNTIDTQAILGEALPPKVSFLATPLSTAIRNFVYDVVLRLLQSDQFERLWIAINTYGHRAVVSFLRGDSRLVQAEQGVVILNLVPILARALQRVQERVPGLLGGKTVPEITYDMPVQEQQQLLQSVVSRQLPPDFATFELFKSDQLAVVQRGIVLFDRVVWVLPVVTLSLMAAAIVLSVRRWRTVLQIGIGVALGLGLALGAIAAVKNQVLEMIIDPTNREAARNTLAEIIQSFQTIARVLIVVGLLLAVAAFVSGDNRFAPRIRGLLGKGSRAAATMAGSVVRHGAETPFPWVAEHRSVLYGAGGAVALVWLLVADTTWALLLLVALLLGIYESAVWVLARHPSEEGGSDATTGVVGVVLPKGPA